MQKVKCADRALLRSPVFINLLARALALDWRSNMPNLANLLQMLLWIGVVIAVFNVIIFVHELGHNFGFYHSSSIYCGKSDYTKFNDKDLLDITNVNINKGRIPLKAVQEVQKRGLRKYVNRTINSFDFDSEGNFIN